MCRILEFLRKGDDIDGFKRTFLYADTAPDTKLFRDERLSFFIKNDGLITGPYPGTIKDTFAATFS